MRKTFLACSLTLLLAAGLAVSEETQAPAVKAEAEIVGLRIAKPAYNNEQEMTPFFNSAGTSLCVLLKTSTAGIVGMDDNKSKITKFVDDKGTDFAKAKPQYGDLLGHFPHISADGKAILLEVTSLALPAKDAQKITVAGTLLVTFAEGQESFKQEKTSVKLGTEIKAGPAPFKVTGVRAEDWDGYKFCASFETRENADKVVGLKFYDAEGKELKSARGGSMSGGKMLTLDYRFAQEPAECTVEVVYWKGLRDVEFPFEVSTGMGS